jgi:hypothetical protein
MSTHENEPTPTCEGFGLVDYGRFDDAELRELHRLGDDEARAELERRGLSTKSLAQADADGDICILPPMTPELEQYFSELEERGARLSDGGS